LHSKPSQRMYTHWRFVVKLSRFTAPATYRVLLVQPLYIAAFQINAHEKITPDALRRSRSRIIFSQSIAVCRQLFLVMLSKSLKTKRVINYCWLPTKASQK